MSYYGHQCKQQCFIPGGVKYTIPVLTQCHNHGVMKSMSCTSCASKNTKLCTARKIIQSSPQCPAPCTSSCVEKHMVEGHSSSCGPRSPEPCTMVFPQPHVQGGQHLCIPHCRQLGITECPQICPPVHMGQHSSYPCSYQWSNSYHYHCGQS